MEREVNFLDRTIMCLLCFFSILTALVSLILIGSVRSKPLGLQTFYDRVIVHGISKVTIFSTTIFVIVFIRNLELDLIPEFINLISIWHKFCVYSMIIAQITVQVIKLFYLKFPSLVYSTDENVLMKWVKRVEISLAIFAILVHLAFKPIEYSTLTSYLANKEVKDNEKSINVLTWLSAFAVFVTFLVQKELVRSNTTKMNYDLIIATKFEVAVGVCLLSAAIFFGHVVSKYTDNDFTMLNVYHTIILYTISIWLCLFIYHNKRHSRYALNLFNWNSQ